MYKDNSSVSGNFLLGHANRHSKQLIYETNIFNIFNDFRFLTVFNSSVDYNFIFSYSFNLNATCDDNLVIPECILILYTELITVLVKLKIDVFSCLTYLHPILYKDNSSVSGNFLLGHANRHSKQLIYETNIFNIFNDFRFLTVFNSSVDYNFIFSYSFNLNATCDDNLVIPECILILYTELITVLVKLKNIFLDHFDYQKLLKTVALMACFNSFNFSQLIYRIFIVCDVPFNLAQENFSSSIY